MRRRPLVLVGAMFLVLSAGYVLLGGRLRPGSKEENEVARACSVLDEVLRTARDFPDVDLKIRVQALAADALWDHEPARARRHMADAFLATSLIVDAARKAPRFLESPGTFLRLQILGVVGPRDGAFAEALIDRIPQRKGGALEASQNVADERTVLRLALARELAKVAPEKAARIIEDSLSRGVSTLTVRALLPLRRASPARADEVFGKALAAAHDAHSRSVAIQALAAYALPGHEGDAGEGEESSTTAGVPDSPVLLPFLVVAADAILCQSLTWREGPEGVSLLAAWKTGQKMLPFVERLLPHLAFPLRERLDAFAHVLPLERQARVESRPNAESLLDAAAATVEPGDRDRLYVQAAGLALADSGPESALALVEKMSKSEDRSTGSALVLLQAVLLSIEQGDLVAARGYVDRVGETRMLAFAAGRLAEALWRSGARGEARQVLMSTLECLSGSSDRESLVAAEALLEIAGVASTQDVDVAFEAASAAVAIMNASTGETALPPRSSVVLKRAPLDLALWLERAFSSLGEVDFERATRVARSLARPESSALAQLGACRAVLRRNNTSSSTRPH